MPRVNNHILKTILKMSKSWFKGKIMKRSPRIAIVPLLLVTIVLLVLITPWFIRTFESDQFTRLHCPQEANKNNIEISARNIKVFTATDFETTREKEDLLLENSECVDYEVPRLSKKTKICIFDQGIDGLISKRLKDHGEWEPKLVGEMMMFLEKNPDVIVVDIGSNLGAFTLAAAAKGHEVIAVDALALNHQRLYESVVKNNLTCRVTQIQNALASQSGQQIEMHLTLFNIAASHVKSHGLQSYHKIVRHTVDSICMNDLVPFIHGKMVYVKMDIESYEDEALRCADDFFAAATIEVLQMEWHLHRQNATSFNFITKYLQLKGMRPYHSASGGQEIGLHSRWPNDVFWIKDLV